MAKNSRASTNSNKFCKKPVRVCVETMKVPLSNRCQCLTVQARPQYPRRTPNPPTTSFMCTLSEILLVAGSASPHMQLHSHSYLLSRFILHPDRSFWARRSARQSCLEGEWEEDGALCVAFAPYLIFSYGSSIFQVDREGTNLKRLVANTSSSVILDYHHSEDRIYWADMSRQGMIGRAFMNGTRKEIVHVTGEGVSGFTVNWIQNTIIWSNHIKGTIEEVTVNGSNPHLLFGDLFHPSDVIVDPYERLLFWLSDGLLATVDCAPSTGGKVKSIFSSHEKLETISLDFNDKRVFWVQYGQEEEEATVGSCDYSGAAVHMMRLLAQSRPFRMSLYADHIYYTDLKRRAIRRTHKYTGRNVVTLNLKPSFDVLADVKVVFPLTSLTDWTGAPLTTDSGCASGQDSCRSVCVSDGDQQCRCAEGFTLTKNGTACEELLPCLSDLTSCSHYCMQTEEGAVCSCPEGSMLAPDGRTCTGPQPYLLFANIHDIRRIHFDGTLYETLLDKQMGRVLALDYDPVESKIYFAHTALKQIERANLDGTEREVLASEDLGLCGGLTVDWINRKLYWTDSGRSEIKKSDLNRMQGEVIIQDNMTKPRGIIVHPLAKRLFWTDEGDKPLIESAFLDGSGRRIVVSTQLIAPTGLAVDYLVDKLYWCDAKRSVIEVAELDGTHRRILTQNNVGRPFSVAVFEDYLWFTDWKNPSVVRVDKRSGQNGVRLRGNMSRPSSLVIVHPLAKPGADPCLSNNGGCSHKCDNRFGVAHCSCHPQFLKGADGRSCYWSESVPLSDEPDSGRLNLSNTPLNSEGSPAFPVTRPTAGGDASLRILLEAEIMISDEGDDCAEQECDINAQCVLTEGGAVCQCIEGFAGNGSTCKDIDECYTGIALCQRGIAVCINTEGGYICKCHAGYTGDGMSCLEFTIPPPRNVYETTHPWNDERHHSCPASHAEYCLHEGVCFHIPEIESYACNCVTGYMGERCQFSDLEWWELQREEEEKRRNLTIAVCMIILVLVLTVGACVTYCNRQKEYPVKNPCTDEMSEGSSSVDSVTGTSGSSAKRVIKWSDRRVPQFGLPEGGCWAPQSCDRKPQHAETDPLQAGKDNPRVESAPREAGLEEDERGFKVGGWKVDNLRQDDDATLTGENEDGLQGPITKVKEHGEKIMRLKLNIKKTKVLTGGRRASLGDDACLLGPNGQGMSHRGTHHRPACGTTAMKASEKKEKEKNVIETPQCLQPH
ncbi:EGF factor, partial [Polypterus senegalus]